VSTPSPVALAIPAVPQPDTPAQDPLVSVQQYQQVTGDFATASLDVEDAVAQATTLACEACTRTFVFGHYIETLYVYKSGMVYPSATPISEVVAPTESVLQGAGIWVGWFFPVPVLPVWVGVVPPQTDVEYWGGYTAETCPPRLARAIAKMAWFMLHPATLSDMPGGVKSVNVGGVSVSGDLSSMVLSDPGLRRDLARFTKRDPHGWSYGVIPGSSG